MALLLGVALAVAAFADPPTERQADEDQTIVVQRERVPGDPRAVPQPSPFGIRPWVRWDCNFNRDRCLIQRRYATLTQCIRARNLYLAQTRWRWAKCTRES
jgi:hypothetical protein